ncbi:MAG: YcaO-like family protein [Caldimicrobium sp.]|nr:YcaO-like family protein [Caldimicrobium sp.]MCX7873550.1 YcaO-like family protein [Caldimicrobium sp.]MDW8094065.1 YcaO-like family protein [Caldimicrobium sp.]
MRDFEKFWKPSPKVIADKALYPEETIRMVEERLRSCGLRVYKGLKRIDKGRLGIPIYLSLYDVDGRKITGNYKQMGKGVTPVLSQASALVELVERFSLFSYYQRVPQHGILSSFKELGDRALPWDVFIKSVEDEEEDSLRKFALEILKEIPFYFVPALEVYTRETKYIPFHWFWVLYEYNGSAGGNTYPEASVQAICELIERHTNALSIRSQKPMPSILRTSIKGEAEQLLSCFERLDIKLWIRDMTFGMPVPTIAVMALDPSTFPHRSEIVYAAGTGTSPERALIRALTEVAQLAGDFDTEGKYVESGLPKFATLEEASLVLRHEGEIALEALPNIYRGDHVEELILLAQALKERDWVVYLIDIEEESLKLPAVYAIIPGILFRERTRIPLLFQICRVMPLYLPPEKNKEILEEILKEVDHRYYVWGYYGNVLKELGEFDEAIKAYERALQCITPENDKVALYTNLADAYFRKGHWDSCIEMCEKALSIEEVAEVYNLLGRALYKRGDYFLALKTFMRATELNPASAIDYANIGYCLKNLNMLSSAEVFFVKALTLDPELVMAKKGLEYCEAFLHSKN